MRPAQIAREIALDGHTKRAAEIDFNEARANCAGNSPKGLALRRPCQDFNEARANCAGNSETNRLSALFTELLQ